MTSLGDLSLAGKAVVVTGAGRGLGAAYAACAAAHGAAVVVNDIDLDSAKSVADQVRAAGGRAVADGSDAGSWEQAGALIERCLTEFGSLDGLVNNAGIITVAPPPADTAEDFTRVVTTNLLGTAFCGTHALRHMVSCDSGAIVNVTSGAALGLAHVAPYAASKGGITALTYSWAASVDGTAIRVNAVSPNAATPLADSLRDAFSDLPTGTHDAESNAPAVIHLLSDACEYHGQVVVTGGPTLRLQARPRIGATTSGAV